MSEIQPKTFDFWTPLPLLLSECSRMYLFQLEFFYQEGER
jgi:hypothetical protein